MYRKSTWPEVPRILNIQHTRDTSVLSRNYRLKINDIKQKILCLPMNLR